MPSSIKMLNVSVAMDQVLDVSRSPPYACSMRIQHPRGLWRTGMIDVALTLGISAAIVHTGAGAATAQAPGSGPQGSVAASARTVAALVDSILPAELRASRIPGAAIAVVVGDSIILAKGYGIASVEESTAVRADAIFRIASTTKMLTGTAVLVAHANKIVDIDGPIRTWIPELRPRLGSLTLRDLLSHRAGLREGSSYYGPHDERALNEFVLGWSDTLFFAPPKDIYSYSNLGFALAGDVLSQAARHSYAEAMKRFVFAPLSMARSTLLPTQAMTFPLVQGHELDSAGKSLIVVRPYSDDARFWPAGSVFTTARDFARFIVAVLNEGRIDGRQALPKEAVSSLLQRQTDVPDGPTSERAGYTFGLVERWRGSTRMLQHGGARIGFGSVVRLFPERRIGIVILTNRTGALPAQTLEAVSTHLVPEAVPDAPSAAATAVRTVDARQILGHYVNTPGELEFWLEDHGGEVVLRQRISGPRVSIRRLQDGRHVAGGQSFRIVRGRSDRQQYLMIAGHALRKVD